MDDFAFIKDTSLRKKVFDSVEYVHLLYTEAKEEGKNALYKEETNRVMVLYVIAVIEALFLYFYKNIAENITTTDYKVLQRFGGNVVHTKDDGELVFALEQEVERHERELGLHMLVKFFVEQKRIKKETANKILDLNSIRNTFHLSKSRIDTCTTETVEDALKLLVYIIKNMSKILK